MTTTPPVTPNPEPFEQQLAQATQWTGGDTALWQRALEQVERDAKPARPSILATINRHARMAAMIVFATIAVVIAAVTTQNASRVDREVSVAPAARPASAEETWVETDGDTRDSMRFDRSDVLLGRSFEITQSPSAPPVRAPSGGAGGAYDYLEESSAATERFAVADVPRPGTDNALSQSFSAQHAQLPPVPELDDADALRERADARAPAPVASKTEAGESADDKLAMSKAADAEPRRDAREESAVKREQPTDPQPVQVVPRAIVRTVNMSIGVEDVRAAFSGIESIVTAAPDSYIESCELRGEGRAASASLVIRVPADNLDPLVAAIRPLGKILVETSSAEDVGDQLVDLEARLTNAQRFEGELLETLNHTNGAKPNEILEVQRAVSQVRENIERLAAQRKQLGLRVALSTIRITLTADPVDPTPARAEGLSGYLGRQLHNAWRGGLVAVANSFAWLVSVIVGGALWWTLLIITALFVRRWLKKRSRQSV